MMHERPNIVWNTLSLFVPFVLPKDLISEPSSQHLYSKLHTQWPVELAVERGWPPTNYRMRNRCIQNHHSQVILNPQILIHFVSFYAKSVLLDTWICKAFAINLGILTHHWVQPMIHDPLRMFQTSCAIFCSASLARLAACCQKNTPQQKHQHTVD